MAPNHSNILGSGHTSNVPWIWEKISRELVKMFCGLDTPGPVYHPPVKGGRGDWILQSAGPSTTTD